MVVILRQKMSFPFLPCVSFGIWNSLPSRDGLYFYSSLRIEVFLSPRATAKSSCAGLAVAPSEADTSILSCVEMSFEPIQLLVPSGGMGLKHGCRVALPPHKMFLPRQQGRAVGQVQPQTCCAWPSHCFKFFFFLLLSTLKNQKISCKTGFPISL